MIKIKHFHLNLLKIEKKWYKIIDIYYIGYITVKDSDYVKTNRVNPLHIIIKQIDGYLEEINGNKDLILVSTDIYTEILTKYTKL